jgi:hypothetical protein
MRTAIIFLAGADHNSERPAKLILGKFCPAGLQSCVRGGASLWAPRHGLLCGSAWHSRRCSKPGHAARRSTHRRPDRVRKFRTRGPVTADPFLLPQRATAAAIQRTAHSTAATMSGSHATRLRSYRYDAHLWIETQDAALAAQIEVAAHAVADLDRRLGQIDTAVEAAVKRGKTSIALSAMEGQRRARAGLVDERNREAATPAATPPWQP